MRSIFNKAGWALAGVLALMLAASFAGLVRGGPLDPADPPGQTGKTLEQIPGAWGRRLDSTNGRDQFNPGCFSNRFECVFPRGVGCNPFCVATVYDGVHDRETGLVWERAPDSSGDIFPNSLDNCAALALGERYGWRLPTREELRSLLDTSSDHMPDGHPFIDVQTVEFDIYWTTVDYNASFSFAINLDEPKASDIYNNDTLLRGWCVRSGEARFDNP